MKHLTIASLTLAAAFFTSLCSTAEAARGGAPSGSDGLAPPFAVLDLHQWFAATAPAPPGAAAAFRSLIRSDRETFEASLEVEGYGLGGQTLGLHLYLGDSSSRFLANLTFQGATSTLTVPPPQTTDLQAIQEHGIVGAELRSLSGQVLFRLDQDDPAAFPDAFTSLLGLEIVAGPAAPNAAGTALWRSRLSETLYEVSLDAEVSGLPKRKAVALTGNGTVPLGGPRSDKRGRLRVFGGWSENLFTGKITPYGPRPAAGRFRLPASFEMGEFQSLIGSDASGNQLFSFAIPKEPSDPLSLTVPGSSNVWAAGRASVADGVLPPYAGFAASAGKVLTFTNVTGSVDYGDGNGPAGPDGIPIALKWVLPSSMGISGIADTYHGGYLVGVFLTDSPAQAPAPPTLDYGVLGHGQETVEPSIGQVFFIGDGWTGHGSGVRQRFIVPPTATRLFLGTPDSLYGDNVGRLQVEFELSDLP